MTKAAAAPKTSKERLAALALEAGGRLEEPPLLVLPPVLPEPPLVGAVPGAEPEAVAPGTEGTPEAPEGRGLETGAPTGGLQVEPSAIW